MLSEGRRHRGIAVRGPRLEIGLAGRARFPENTEVPAPLAQLAEQLTLNQRVVGSSPTRGSPLILSHRVAFNPDCLLHDGVRIVSCPSPPHPIMPADGLCRFLLMLRRRHSRVEACAGMRGRELTVSALQDRFQLSNHELPRRVRHVQHRPVKAERPDIATCLAVQRELAQDFAEQRGKLEAVARAKCHERV
jgi:hypothetical protein